MLDYKEEINGEKVLRNQILKLTKRICMQIW